MSYLKLLSDFEVKFYNIEPYCQLPINNYENWNYFKQIIFSFLTH